MRSASKVAVEHLHRGAGGLWRHERRGPQSLDGDVCGVGERHSHGSLAEVVLDFDVRQDIRGDCFDLGDDDASDADESLDEDYLGVAFGDLVAQVLLGVGGDHATEDEHVEIADVVVVEHGLELVGRICEVAPGAQQVDSGHENVGAAPDDEDASRLVGGGFIHRVISMVCWGPTEICGWSGWASASGSPGWWAGSSWVFLVARARTAAAAAKAAPAASACRRPDVVASGIGVPAARRWWIRPVPTAEKMASPRAPPSCWEELRMAAASPARLGPTPALAAVVTPTNTGPTPTATRSSPGRMWAT